MWPEAGVTPERPGLGAWLEVLGGTVFDGGLIVSDDLAAFDSETYDAIVEWCETHPLHTATGTRPRQILSVGEFSREVLLRQGYGGRFFIMGARLARSIDLCSVWRTARLMWPRFSPRQPSIRRSVSAGS